MNIFSELPNTDHLTTGNFYEKDFGLHSACSVHADLKNFNNSTHFVKFVRFRRSLNFPGLLYMANIDVEHGRGGGGGGGGY